MEEAYGERVAWEPTAPKFGLLRVLVAMAVLTASVYVAAGPTPGVALDEPGAGLAGRALARGPERDRAAAAGRAAAAVHGRDRLHRDPARRRRAAAGWSTRRFPRVAARRRVRRRAADVDRDRGGGIVLQVVERHERRRRVHAAGHAPDRAAAGRDARTPTRPGSSTSRSTASRCRCSSARCATAARRRWRAGSPTTATTWRSGRPTSRRRPAPARPGILLGSNEDIPAFRWVEKETATMMVCSSAADCVEIERRHSTGVGLLADGGASRGNLLSGEAEDAILTVSRMDAEKRANPGYRAFLANGFNVTRLLVLYLWEVVLEWVAAARQKRRDVRPRGHRGGIYPFLRGAMCVFIRDLIVFSVLTDMMRGRPGGVRDVRQLRRGRPPLRASSGPTPSRRCASSTSSSPGSSTPAATRRVRTRSSCSPTTARRRARRSSSATATGSTSSSQRSLAQRRAWPRSRAATSSRRSSATPSGRPPARTARSGRRTTSPAATSSCSAPATSG